MLGWGLRLAPQSALRLRDKRRARRVEVFWDPERRVHLDVWVDCWMVRLKVGFQGGLCRVDVHPVELDVAQHVLPDMNLEATWPAVGLLAAVEVADVAPDALLARRARLDHLDAVGAVAAAAPSGPNVRRLDAELAARVVVVAAVVH